MIDKLFDPALVEDLFFNKIETFLINFHSFQKLEKMSQPDSVFFRMSIENIENLVISTNRFIHSWHGEEAQNKIVSFLLDKINSENLNKNTSDGQITYSTTLFDVEFILKSFLKKN